MKVIVTCSSESVKFTCYLLPSLLVTISILPLACLYNSCIFSNWNYTLVTSSCVKELPICLISSEDNYSSNLLSLALSELTNTPALSSDAPLILIFYVEVG